MPHASLFMLRTVLPHTPCQVVNRQDSTTKLSRLYGATVKITSDDGASTIYTAKIPSSGTGAQSRCVWAG